MAELIGLEVDIDTSSADRASASLQNFDKAAARTAGQTRAIEAAAKRMGISFEEAATKFDRTTNSLKTKTNAIRAAENVAGNFAGRLGTLGTVMTSFGGSALIAAAGIGAVAIAIQQAVSASLALANRAGMLKDFAETTGFTVLQLQALQKMGSQVGVSAASTTGSLEKFSVAMDDVRKGSGAAYESILEVDKALAHQLTQVTSLSQAWDIIAQAIAKADIEQANKLARALFGRGGIDMTRLARGSTGAGGIDELVRQLKDVDRITTDQADRWDTLGDTIEENMRQASQNVASIFADPVLSGLEKLTSGLLKMSQIAAGFQMSGDFLTFVNRVVALPGNLLTGRMDRMPFQTPSAAPKAGSTFDQRWGDNSRGPATRTMEDVRADTDKRNLNVWIEAQERFASVAGAAITPAQQLQLAIAKINLAQKEGKISAEQQAQAVGALNAQFASNQFSTYIGLLGQAASIEEQVRLKTLQINDARRQGISLSKEQIDTQLRLTRENALGVTQLQAQAEAYRIEADTMFMATGQATAYSAAQNLINQHRREGKTLTEEQIATINREAEVLGTAAQRTENLRATQDLLRGAFVSVSQSVREGTNIWQAFGNAALDSLGRIADRLASMAADRAIMGLLGLGSGGGGSGGGLLSFLNPLSRGIGSVNAKGNAFNQGRIVSVNAKGNAFDRGNVIPFPSNSIVTRPTIFAMANGAGLMGEAGEEAVMPLRRGPGGRLGVEASGGGGGGTVIHIEDNSVNHISGGDIDEVRAEIANQKASFHSRVISAVREGKQRRQL